jgi:hypothetical protein
MLTCLECGKKLPRLQWTHFKFKCTGNIKNGKEYLERYPHAILVDIELAKKTAVTLENLVQKYGPVEGVDRFAQYKNKQAYSNSFEYKKQKFDWTAEQYDAFNKSRAITLPNIIKKYGEVEGLVKWQEYCEKQRKSCTLDHFVTKWGKDEGSRKYHNWMKKWVSNGKTEKNILIKLQAVIDDPISTQIRLCKNNQSDKRFGYFYDYGNIDKKKLIEFNGTHWHADPRVYEKDSILPRINKTAGDIWAKDLVKLNCALDQNYQIYTIWEEDWKKNESTILKEVRAWWYRK